MTEVQFERRVAAFCAVDSAEEKELQAETKIINAVRNNTALTFAEKLKLASEQGRKVLSNKIKDEVR